jgi:hypothetical protein
MADAIVQPQQNPPRTKSSQYRDVYANACNVRLGPFDVTLVFGQMIESAPETVVIEDQFSVTVSPQQMKAIVRVMAETLDAYEKMFGALAIPEDLTKPKFSAGDIIEKFNAFKAPASTSAIAPQQPSPQSRGAARKKA